MEFYQDKDKKDSSVTIAAAALVPLATTSSNENKDNPTTANAGSCKETPPVFHVNTNCGLANDTEAASTSHSLHPETVLPTDEDIRGIVAADVYELLRVDQVSEDTGQSVLSVAATEYRHAHTQIKDFVDAIISDAHIADASSSIAVVAGAITPAAKAIAKLAVIMFINSGPLGTVNASLATSATVDKIVQLCQPVINYSVHMHDPGTYDPVEVRGLTNDVLSLCGGVWRAIGMDISQQKAAAQVAYDIASAAVNAFRQIIHFIKNASGKLSEDYWGKIVLSSDAALEAADSLNIIYIDTRRAYLSVEEAKLETQHEHCFACALNIAKYAGGAHFYLRSTIKRISERRVVELINTSVSFDLRQMTHRCTQAFGEAIKYFDALTPEKQSSTPDCEAFVGLFFFALDAVRDNFYAFYTSYIDIFRVVFESGRTPCVAAKAALDAAVSIADVHRLAIGRACAIVPVHTSVAGGIKRALVSARKDIVNSVIPIISQVLNRTDFARTAENRAATDPTADILQAYDAALPSPMDDATVVKAVRAVVTAVTTTYRKKYVELVKMTSAQPAIAASGEQ